MQQKIKLALADDHTLFRAGTRELLESFGDIEVILEASNGQELLNLLTKGTGMPDICILDVSMPVLNGYDTASALRLSFPEVKILAVSMHDSEFSMIKMLRSGAGGYMLKDAQPEELHKAVHHLYQKNFYHSELVSSRLISQVRQNRKDILSVIDITENELRFLQWMTSELTIKEISEKMGLKPRTLEKYAEILYAKLNIRTRTGLAMFAIKSGIVPLGEKVKPKSEV